ncbi:MAG TPA: helix-turn-helix domain-containing protein, partial [Deltaproteobacteria bacterium]|nr:helix-turn-helix domain-containing protein [Deltaproteobacteria bacterium]
IALIVAHMLERMNRDFGRNVKTISPEVLRIFESYDWPGNVRELANILERILYSMDGIEDTVQINHLPLFFRTLAAETTRSQAIRLKNLKADSEREALLHAINLANNNKNRAAQLLGIHRTALYKKMKKLNLPLKPT